jgi:hypothetical protein
LEFVKQYIKTTKFILLKYNILHKYMAHRNIIFLLWVLLPVFLSVAGFFINGSVAFCDLEEDFVWNSLENTPDRYRHYIQHYINYPHTDSTHIPVGAKQLIQYRINSLSTQVLEDVFSAPTEHDALSAIRYYAGSGGPYELEREFDFGRANSNFIGFSQQTWNNIDERFDYLDENVNGSHSSQYYTGNSSVGQSEMSGSGDTNFYYESHGICLPSAINSPAPQLSPFNSKSILGLELESPVRNP